MNYHGEGTIQDARANGTAVIMNAPSRGIVSTKRKLRVTYALWDNGKHNPNMGEKYLWDFEISYAEMCVIYDGRPTGRKMVDIPKWHRLITRIAEDGNLSKIVI